MADEVGYNTRASKSMPNITSRKSFTRQSSAFIRGRGASIAEADPKVEFVAKNTNCHDSGAYNQEHGHHLLTVSSIPAGIRDFKYAVRGAIAQRAGELETMLNDGKELPFTEMFYCNIGNPQIFGMKPITFHRQVLSLCVNPALLGDKANGYADSQVEKLGYPADVIERAKAFCKVPFGSYSHSKGHKHLREYVAKFFEKRDGIPADPEEIFLTDGASAGAKVVLDLLIRDESDGVLIPVPQYPLYSASITRCGGTAVPYYTNEEKSWSFTKDDLVKARDSFLKDNPKGTLRGLCVINPGNPTGGVLGEAEMKDCIDFCEENEIVLIADEVYQENIWDESKKFTSFRKVCEDNGSDIELFSLHSISKGYYGECGMRGGILQCTNIDDEVVNMIFKMACLNLCSHTLGQAMIATVLNPPEEGDPSYPLFIEEKSAILASMKRKSRKVNAFLNGLENVTCAPCEGAMYVFPSLHVTSRWTQAADAAGQLPDMYYCLELLEATGVVAVPGSGFRQKEDTWHFRMTILPSEEQFNREGGIFDSWTKFHKNWMDKFRD